MKTHEIIYAIFTEFTEVYIIWEGNKESII